MDIYQDPLFRDLERLNYTINEAKVYLTLIKLGSSLAGDIAKESHLDRSSTYNALKSLIGKGVVSTIYETKRTIFVPSDPKTLLDYFKEKEEIAKRIIPKIKKQFEATKSPSSVKLFKGYKGVKTVFTDILDTMNEKETYCCMASEGKFTSSMPYFAPIFKKMQKDQKIKTQMLVRKGRKKEFGGSNTEYREVPSDVESPATINVYKDKVAIFIWEGTPQAILIENKDVAKTLENYFKFMWTHAKKK